ncbi:MAG: carboxypeptidase-like regulatory domain-containing protein, partial [Bacteroidia bacterium]|nr:carboxypeptidase-like regulatory domain-containing protein [Bacteroidia bacterium]
MKYYAYLIIIYFLWAYGACAQVLTGTVKYPGEEGKFLPLPGATVRILDGAGAVTDAEGRFSISVAGGRKSYRLVVEAVGFRTDTVVVEPGGAATIVLSDAIAVRTIEVQALGPGTRLSTLDTYRAEELTRVELTKAACCNLSESFETNASVDVSYSDAVTGIKEIQMLGLTGAYTQITT